MSKKVTPALRKRLQAQVRKSAKNETADYCDSMAAFIFMGPVPERDRVIGKTWEAEAARKRKEQKVETETWESAGKRLRRATVKRTWEGEAEKKRRDARGTPGRDRQDPKLPRDRRGAR